MIADKGKYTLEFIIIGMLAFGIIRLFDLQDELRNLSNQIQKSQSVLMEIPMVQNEIRERNDFLRSLAFENRPYCTDFGEAFIKMNFSKRKNLIEIKFKFKNKPTWTKPVTASYQVQGGHLSIQMINFEGELERKLVSAIKTKGPFVDTFVVDGSEFSQKKCQ